jgi:hypothetical protein
MFVRSIELIVLGSSITNRGLFRGVSIRAVKLALLEEET